MEVLWSPHARDLLADILTTITLEQSPEDAYRWRQDIDNAIEPIYRHPLIGMKVHENCFASPIPDADKLHQLLCGPYRIIYEPTSVACYILSIRHCRMMLHAPDSHWN